MMNCSNLYRMATRLFGVVIAAAMAVGCSAVVDPDLGFEFVPENQKMQMRHLTFKGDKVISFNTATSTADKSEYSERDCKYVETSLLCVDSLLSSNVSYGFMGVERSDTFGMRSARFASSLMFMNIVDEETGWGYRPIFDSIKLVLTIENYGADTVTPVKYNVYELRKPLLGSLISAADTTAYTCSNIDAADIINRNEPIFTFTFPNGKESVTSASIDLEPTNMAEGGASWNFIRRLMLIPDNYKSAEWDGYARDNDSLYKSEKKFASTFHGVYIEPDMSSVKEAARGSLYAIQLAASGIYLQGRNRNPEDPTLIKDTIGMAYYFIDESSAEIKSLCMSANMVDHDYQKSLTSTPSLLAGVRMAGYDNAGNRLPHSERDLVSECYVEGMAGVVTEVYFTDAFLQELWDMHSENGEEFRAVSINQCLMKSYLKDASYSWEETQSNTATLLESLNSSIVRLGTYTNINTLTAISDYYYQYEQQQSTELAYNGKLNRSRACYVMDITAHMQLLCNYVRTLKEEGKQLSDYDEAKMPRTVQLGPEAISPYTMKRTVLQGANTESTTTTAPIEIDITYTMIK